MIILNLKMKNFKQYRDQEIDFRQGLTGVIGRNGSGKSSIFEAILLALYGEIPFLKDYLRNSSAGDKDAVKVELAFEIDERSYRVVREFRGKNLAPSSGLYDHDSEIAAGQKDVTAQVAKLIGMGRDAFTRSIFSGQKELGALSSATGSERRLLVRKMVGMDRIDAVQKFLRIDKNNLKNEISGQEKFIFSEDEIETRKKSLAEMTKGKAGLEKEVTRLSDDFNRAVKVYNEAKEDFSLQQRYYKQFTAINNVAIELNTKVQGNERSIAAHREKLLSLEKGAEELAELDPGEKEYWKVKEQKEAADKMEKKNVELKGLEKQAAAFKTDIEKIAQDLDGLIKDLKKMATVSSDLEKAEKGIKEIEKAIEKNTAEKMNVRSEIGRVKGLIREREDSMKAIKKAGKESACPTCLRPLKDAYEETLDRLHADIETYQERDLQKHLNSIKEIDDKGAVLKEKHKTAVEGRDSLKEMSVKRMQLETSVSKLKNDSADKEKEHGKIIKQIAVIGEVDYDEKKHKIILKKLLELEKIHERYLALSVKVREIPTLKNDIINLEKETGQCTEELKKLKEDLKEIPYSEEAHKKAEDQQKKAESEKEKSREEMETIKDNLKDIINSLREVEKELADNKKREKTIKESKKKFISLQKLDAYLDSFKNVILDRVRPLIAAYGGRLFQQLTNGAYESINIDDDFNFEIMDNGRYYPIQRFSGGEVDLANLCLRLAISNVIRDLSGSGSVGFLGFDEIFGSQDRERRSSILSAFHKLEEMYRQIFIISHIDEIKEDFPQILEVSRTPGRSSVKYIDE